MLFSSLIPPIIRLNFSIPDWFSKLLKFSRENVLIIPQRAVIEKNGKKIVRIPSGKNYQEIEVQTGLRGSEGEIEIISGLREGDKVITFIKEK